MRQAGDMFAAGEVSGELRASWCWVQSLSVAGMRDPLESIPAHPWNLEKRIFSDVFPVEKDGFCADVHRSWDDDRQSLRLELRRAEEHSDGSKRGSSAVRKLRCAANWTF